MFLGLFPVSGLVSNTTVVTTSFAKTHMMHRHLLITGSVLPNLNMITLHAKPFFDQEIGRPDGFREHRRVS